MTTLTAARHVLRVAAVWQQAANRLPPEQALIYALTTGDWDGST